jgi:radical SAM superfamily enzyme YgiQ (UPF0313 family)
MSVDVLLVKAVTCGSEVFFADTEINGYNLTRDVPLPSISVLASWMKAKGYTTGFFDLDRNDYNELLENARECDVVGFYLNYSGHFRVMKAVEQVKDRYPEKLVVIGGPSVLSLREGFFEWTRSGFLGLIRENPGHYVDAIVYGEGEIALETILKYKDNPDEIGALIDTGHESSWGILYKDRKGELHISKKAGIVSDLSVLPIPVYPLDEGHIPVAFIETSRGCAYKCPFCEMPGLYNTRRVKRKEQIEAEVNSLQKLGIRHVIITDPAIYPSKRMDMISEVFTGRGMRWTGYAKPGCWKSRRPLYSKETLRKARESGCVSLFFGGESACEITQKVYDKPKAKVLLATEQLCQEVGLLSCWSFMILNPGETSQDVDRLIDLLKEMSPELAVFTPFILMPDSEMDRHPGKYKLRITESK